ncbi:MAG: alpha/beta fold hydrolase, partial [Bacteroidia bacterium]|nr:alpha/beta fold hydrolase [Bacteroidia bacterium]
KQKDLPFRRVRIETPDDDFLDIDILEGNNKRLAILCHGLEGSSKSHYILGTSGMAIENSWDVAALNYRGCSGEMNRQRRMYHSGATDDLDLVLKHFSPGYQEIALVGFSLGGNLVLKYCGERPDSLDTSISSVTGISVPCDLAAGCRHIGKSSNFIYEKKFLVSLKEKIRQKEKQFPGSFDMKHVNSIHKLYDFDDQFTAPIHGFKDAEDYYGQSNCKQFLNDIRIPCKIISALDDPFLPSVSYPFKEADENPSIRFIASKFGGHVGFVRLGEAYYWNELKTIEFMNEQSGDIT